ncbi:polysaccharide biosynthesis protein GumB [Sphingobium sp. IP1]|uniref:polysaccharide biosynthesis/export family protein n=1 Tax=Sphingobium sp. IP1 TaxID=2021637 RepID=UPI000C0685D9|nr:polysaccharide biosynthesis/export family protein [Sphingobium sp. IP1]PHP16417.1 polysaccharide biosynthesis protein GumB [Sphingobium sp. IP1]
MNSIRRLTIAPLFLPLVLSLSGCFSPADLPRGEAAYRLMPAEDPASPRRPYYIGPEDKISIRVFQEPDLSFDELQVDSGGNINFPLIGELAVSGKTPNELGAMIASRLGQNFIRDPQVMVGIVQSVAQRVTVSGNVMKPGVYEIAGTSSLLEAVSRAEGLTRVAVKDQVLIFRTIDGQRSGAIFNLALIEEGRAPDPQILGGDQIVIGFSAVKGTYRDFLTAAPLFNIFRRY